jgi:hypothetical protein
MKGRITMREEMSERDLKERFALIETMIAEGRRSTESWGWVFVLWGIADLVAVAWASWGTGGMSIWGNRSLSVVSVRSGLAWPVTMIGTAILTMAIGFRKGKGRPGSSSVRAIVSIWISVGIAMFLLFTSLGVSGRLDEHAFVAIIAAMLGVANGASGFLLRWKAQIACAVVWWMASVAACFGTVAQTTAVFLAAVFLCQIVFGVYAMMLESQRARGGLAHA